MRKSNEQTLKQAIDEMLKTYRLDGKLKEVQAINAWEKLMGKMIAKHTKSIYIKDKKLFVEVDSSALRQELSYSKEKIIQLVNEEAGELIINEVVLR